MIGQGGMGLVYKARHAATGEEIAIKTVRAATQGLLQRMRREILALSRMRHPGLVQFVATGLGESLPWYGMELLSGHDAARLHASGYPAGASSCQGLRLFRNRQRPTVDEVQAVSPVGRRSRRPGAAPAGTEPD